jgi:hypothetical protein
MFKVMLVKPFTDVKPEYKNAPRPEIGDIDEVTDEIENKGDTYYRLARFGIDYAYQSKLFAIVPEPSADDMQEETKEAIVNLQPA